MFCNCKGACTFKMINGKGKRGIVQPIKDIKAVICMT